MDTGAAGTAVATAPVPPPTPLLIRYVKFLLVGFTGVLVNLIVFVLVLDAISPSGSVGFVAKVAHFLSRSPVDTRAVLAASIAAFAVATLWNFTLNSLWTFRSAVGHRHPVARRVQFYFLVSLASLALNELVLYALTGPLAPLVAQGVGIVAGSVVGFVGNSRVTFEELEPRGAL